MPDIYGNISPLTDTPEVASTSNVKPADLSVHIAPFTPFEGDRGATSKGKQGNDLDRLMNSIDKETNAQPWVKNSIYTMPAINTPFQFTTRYLDADIGWDATDKDLEAKYGAKQGTVSRVFNRLAKTGATAAISFAEQLNSTINLLSGNRNVDNAGVTAGNEWLEKLDNEILPNYQTQYQKDHPLLSYLPNPFEMKSFLDNVGKVTQNLGFTIGAMAGAAVLDVPVAAVTEGLGEIPLLAAQSKKIFSGIGKLARMATGSAEELNAYKAAINSGDDVLKALARASTIKTGSNAVRFLNSSLLSAYGESVMEGNSIYRETKKGLQQQFTDSYGNYTGTQEDTARIEEAAKNAGQAGLKGNMAFLSISNMFGLGSVLRPGAAAIRATEASLAKEVSIKLAEKNINAFELVANKATGIQKLFKNGNKAGSLLLENSKESLEEAYQFGVEKAATNYYTRKFNDRSNNDVNALSESINNAFSQVFTTTEGQESMLMGLLGGMVQAGAQGIIQKRQGIKSGAALGQHMVDTLNSAKVTSLFDVTRTEAVTSADLARDMQEAAKNGDMFTYKNLQHQALFNLVDTGVRANKFDLRIEQLESLKGLNKENFESLFNIELNSENKATVSAYVDGIVNKAREIKQDIDKVNNIFGSNPYSAKKDPIHHHAFETYKAELALTVSEQRDHLRRVSQLRDNLSSRLPAAPYQPLIDLASERGIDETVAKFNKRIADLANSEELAKGNTDLTKGMKEEREYLEGKVKEIQNAVTNEGTYQKDFLGIVNSLHNYYGNGNSLYGNSHISRVDSLELFNKSKDIHALNENTKRIQRYYEQLTGKDGFKNFDEDISRRITDFADRVRVDEDGTFRVLSDEELDATLPTEDDSANYVQNTLDVASVNEGEEKIDKDDKELIAKLLDDGEKVEEGEKTTAQKIRDGDTPITDEIRETAKARLRSEFEPITSETEVGEVKPVSTKASERERRTREQAKAKGVAIADDISDDETNINDIMGATTTSAQPVAVEAPTEITTNPIVRFWDKFKFKVTKEFNRVLSFDNDKGDVKYKTNLDRIVVSNMKPESLQKNLIGKLTLEVTKSTKGKTPDQRSLMRYFPPGNQEGLLFDNLYRAGFDVDVNVMVGDTQVGIMHPPTSVQFKRGDEFLTLDKLVDANEYAAVTLNHPSTFDQFKKDFDEYKAAYDEVTKGFKAGEMLHVSNEKLLKTFFPVISYGSIEYSKNAKTSTPIKSLKYRGKGDAILSFPMEYDPQTERYERTKQPNILNESELTPEQVAETLEHVGANIDKIHAQDVRYIYLMRMPDGNFGNQSILVARPDDETPANLDSFVDQLKAGLANAEHESVFKLNADLGEALYIAHTGRKKDTKTRRTSARFSIRRYEKKKLNTIELNIYNQPLRYSKRIEFSQEEINGLKGMDDLIALANEKIGEAKVADRTLMNIGFELKKEDFKKNLANDENVSNEDLESKLKVSVTPRVFANTSITFMPANGQAYVPPTSPTAKGRKATKPAKVAEGGKQTEPAKTTAPVAVPNTVSKTVADIHVGQTYIADGGVENTVIKISDLGGKTKVEYVNKDGVEANAEANAFLAAHTIKEPEVAPSASTGSTPAPNKGIDYGADIVNKNLNNILTQLKAQGLVKTDC